VVGYSFPVELLGIKTEMCSLSAKLEDLKTNEKQELFNRKSQKKRK